MSYILEALKKSEQKRKREGVPSLQTVHEGGRTDARQKTPLWPWILLAALCMNVVILLVVLPSWQEDKNLTVPETALEQHISDQPVVAETNVSSGSSLEAEFNSVKQPAHDNQTIEQDTQTTEPLSALTVPHSLPALQSTAGTLAIQTFSQDREITSQPLSTADKQGETNTVVTNPELITEEMGEDDTLASLPLDDPLETDPFSALEKSGSPTQDTKQDRKIPLLDNLPQNIRAKLPELSISFHVYAKKPKARLVSINGRVLHEGQSMADGLTVEEITSEGIILNFNGDLFRMEVF